jgi:hypothetical protein
MLGHCFKIYYIDYFRGRTLNKLGPVLKCTSSEFYNCIRREHNCCHMLWHATLNEGFSYFFVDPSGGYLDNIGKTGPSRLHAYPSQYFPCEDTSLETPLAIVPSNRQSVSTLQHCKCSCIATGSVSARHAPPGNTVTVCVTSATLNSPLTTSLLLRGVTFTNPSTLCAACLLTEG